MTLPLNIRSSLLELLEYGNFFDKDLFTSYFHNKRKKLTNRFEYTLERSLRKKVNENRLLSPHLFAV